jgi:hypothetical protein
VTERGTLDALLVSYQQSATSQNGSPSLLQVSLELESLGISAHLPRGKDTSFGLEGLHFRKDPDKLCFPFRPCFLVSRLHPLLEGTFEELSFCECPSLFIQQPFLRQNTPPFVQAISSRQERMSILDFSVH